MMLFSGGCGAPVKRPPPLQGFIKDGIYYSAARNFNVRVPIFTGLEVHDGKDAAGLEWVDFQVGCCNWVAAGGYSLEWRVVEKPAKNFGEFETRADLQIKTNIKQTIDQGTLFTTIHQVTRAINGKQAKQVVGRIKKDSVDAYYVATAVNYGRHQALAILVFLVRPEDKGQYYDAPEWKRYTQLLETLKSIPPSQTVKR